MRFPGSPRAALCTAFAVLLSTGCASKSPVIAAPAPTAAPAPSSGGAPPNVAAVPGPATDAAPVAADADDVQPVPIPIAGTEFVRGRSTVKVNAPIEKVRAAVLDFAHYADFMPHYSGSKLLGRTATGARDVYMEIEALYGAVKMWAEVEFPKPTLVDDVETYESTFVKGNVKDFKAIWRLRKIDDATTELSLEVFLHPSIPMPTKLMNGENLGGSAKGVKAMRARAEASAR